MKIFPRRSLPILMSLVILTLGVNAEELVIESAELAGIHGHPDFWDTPFVLAEDGATREVNKGYSGSGPVADWTTEKPGAPAFDAIHRSLLVRFPGATEKITTALKEGKEIVKAEIFFEYVTTEFFPLNYSLPSGMSFLGNLWVKKPPRWHAIAYALRQPWRADPKRGPTYNAASSGNKYHNRFWAHFGAQDTEKDRYPQEFGPTEVSYKVTENLMDVTASLTDDSFGNSLGQRLRHMEDNGFLVRKWETYDALFNHGFYEYGGAPGHRGIIIKAPKLVITLKPGKSYLGEIPPAPNPLELPHNGQPTAVMPDDETIRGYIERYGVKRSNDMPLWQYRRIQELIRLDDNSEGGFPKSVEAYKKWVQHWMELPYRQFTGHHTPLSATEVLLYGDAMPAPMLEHLKKYWDAWLMPGRPYYETAHNQWSIWIKPENSYYARTGDWRGNHSFYRGGYTRFMSTMNFNHNATMGALLGGAITDNKEALEDGRFALEYLLLRLWSWYDGTTQESIDHYYLGLTLYGQKSFADLGPKLIDRVMGQSMLLKTMDELASCYHPALKRFIATSGRSGVAEVFTINEGVNSIMHTVSKKGALHNIGNKDRLGSPLFGNELPPALVGRQALVGPWMPLWMGNIVDHKPLPFQLTQTYKVWGQHREYPLWKKSYLGKFYGLSTRDLTGGNEIIPTLGLWRRAPGKSADIQDVGALFIRYGVNNTEFYDSIMHGMDKGNPNGIVGTQGGYQMALQHKNKAVVVLSPFADLKIFGRAAPKNVHSFQSSIALANYQDNPDWIFYIDGKPADLSKLPIDLDSSSRIVIHDGVSYVGLIPIPATDFGRQAELRITDGGEPVKLQGGGEAAPTLVINNYNYHNPDKAFPYGEDLTNNADLSAKLARAYNGFVIEMGDNAEYSTVEDFQTHIDQATLDLRWDTDKDLLHVAYSSGSDTLEMGVRPQYRGARLDERSPSTHCFAYRRVNGKWPYLPQGMERDSTIGQQGRTGRLEKNGSALTFQAGLMGYLLTDPKEGNVLFANPLPDPQYMVMNAPGGVLLKADGKLGLTHCLVNSKKNQIEIQYALKGGQHSPAMAEALYVFGANEEPQVTLNHTPLADLQLVKLDNLPAWRIPLRPDDPARTVQEIAQAYAESSLQALSEMSALSGIRADMKYLPEQEHYILTMPRTDSYEFWRQWPGASPYYVTVPGGVAIATDGNLALQRIMVDSVGAEVLVDYAPYLQRQKETGEPIPNRARALLIFGMDNLNKVILHGRVYKGDIPTVTVDGRKASVVPLFDDPVTEVVKGIEKRYQQAMDRIMTAESKNAQ